MAPLSGGLFSRETSPTARDNRKEGEQEGGKGSNALEGHGWRNCLSCEHGDAELNQLLLHLLVVLAHLFSVNHGKCESRGV